MVCDRCILAVKQLSEQFHLPTKAIRLGTITLTKPISTSTLTEFETKLNEIGFEIIQSKEQKVVDRIKQILIELIYKAEQPEQDKLSSYLVTHFHQDYSSISTTFSALEEQTIEQYYIQLKIERAKELLLDDELTMSEIAFELNYSSQAYFSNQFKSITGQSPSAFRKNSLQQRQSLNQL